MCAIVNKITRFVIDQSQGIIDYHNRQCILTPRLVQMLFSLALESTLTLWVPLRQGAAIGCRCLQPEAMPWTSGTDVPVVAGIVHTHLQKGLVVKPFMS